MKLRTLRAIGKLGPLKMKVLRLIGHSEKDSNTSSTESGIPAGSNELAKPFSDYSIEAAKAQAITSAHAYWMMLDKPR